MNQLSEFVTERFEGTDLQDFQGLLVIRAPEGPVSATMLRTRGVRFTSFPVGPEVASSDDENVLIIARLGDGRFGSLSFATLILLMNNSAHDTVARITLFKADGTPFEVGMSRLGGQPLQTRAGKVALDSKTLTANEFVVELPAGSGAALQSDAATDPGAVGWAQISSDIQISGGAAFTISEEASGAFVAEVGGGGSALSPLFVFFSEVDASQGINTGVGLTSPSAVPLRFLLRLLRANEDDLTTAGVENSPGQTELVVAEKPLEVAAFGHEGVFLTEIFTDVPDIQQGNFRGLLEARVLEPGLSDFIDPPVAAITLRTRGPLLTSLPASPAEVLFRPELTTRASTSLGGAKPDLCFDIRQQGDEIPVHNIAL